MNSNEVKPGIEKGNTPKIHLGLLNFINSLNPESCNISFLYSYQKKNESSLTHFPIFYLKTFMYAWTVQEV